MSTKTGISIWGYGERECSLTVGGMQTGPASVEISAEISHKAKFRTQNPGKSLLGIYLEDPKPNNRDTHTSKLMAVLVTIWKEDVCQLMDR